MSCSSSKPSSFPPTNPQPQLESTLNIPPHPGSCLQSSLTNSTISSNRHPIPNSQNQNVNQTLITFRHVLQYYWRGIYNIENQSNNHNIAYPTPPQIWLAQNVYPLVTPMRMICFVVSLISFIIACGFFMETELYNTYVSSGGHHYALLLVFLVAVVHFLFLIFLMFFSFFTSAYEMYKNHFLLKSLGEFIVMRVMSLLISGIEHDHQEGSSEVAALVTCAFLTVDSLCIIILLKPGHHYSLLDATLTLTLHLALEGEGIYAITADFFVFIILAFKNFLWRHIGHMHPSNNEQLQLVWFASDQAVDILSSV